MAKSRPTAARARGQKEKLLQRTFSRFLRKSGSSDFDDAGQRQGQVFTSLSRQKMAILQSLGGKEGSQEVEFGSGSALSKLN